MGIERPFGYGGGELCCEGVALSAVADRYGTPTYVYSASAIRGAYAELDRAFAALPHRVYYSVKANPNLAVCSLLAGLGAGADVTSGGELERALRAGFRPSTIVFAGVGKSREELREALRAGIGLFSVESEGELRLLSRVADAMGLRAPIALRVNPDVDPRTHPYITTGLARNKFGVPLSDARALYGLAASLPGIRVEGVGMHIGSQLEDLSPMIEAARSLAALAGDLLAAGHPLRYLDIGGGYAVPYGEASPDPPARVARELDPLVRPLGLTLLTEPGRRLVGGAGALLLRVLYRKTNGARQFLVTDGGMNALLRPALYGARHRIVAVREGAGETEADVVGPVCESADFLSRDTLAPNVQPGELLAVLDAGAYGFAMSSEYNGRPRPAEVLVDGGDTRLVRRRQTYDEMMAPELGL
jgi:diaminopimelate decarboxylase